MCLGIVVVFSCRYSNAFSGGGVGSMCTHIPSATGEGMTHINIPLETSPE